MKAFQKNVGFLCAIVLLPASLLHAQNSWATLSGHVLDATGSGISDVTVKAFPPGTTDTAQTKSSKGGAYSIPFLPPGTFTVQFSANGFQKLTKTAVSIQAADTVSLEVILEIGDVSNMVTVAVDSD